MFDYFIHHKARIILIFLINVGAFLIAAHFMPQIGVNSVTGAILAVCAVSLVNIILRPLIVKLITHLPLLLFALAALFLDAAILYITAFFFDAIDLSSLWDAFWLALIISLVNVIASSLLHIEDSDSYFQNVTRKFAKKEKGALEGKRGNVVIQIDGLAAPILFEEIKKGKMPTLAKLLDDKSHTFVEWETDLPSMTPASQTAFFYGEHKNIPSFRWFDKEQDKVILACNPKDARFIENFVSEGKTGLLKNGTSINNLFSGGASHNVMVASHVLKEKGEGGIKNEDFKEFMGSPYTISRTLVLMIWEMIVELWEELRQTVTNRRPRMNRFLFAFPIVRACSCILLREITTYVILAEMWRSRPVIYADYLSYDELSHYTGPETPDTKRALHKLDKTFEVIADAISKFNLPYDLVFLSDHGQSIGDTFKQRYKKSLKDVIVELAKDAKTTSLSDGSEGIVQTGAFFGEATEQKGTVGKVSKKLLGKKAKDGYVNLNEKKDAKAQSEVESSDVVTCASGNLCEIYFRKVKRRMTAEEIEKMYPGLIEGLAKHPGLGFVMVKSEKEGAVVIGAKGSMTLLDKKITGENPLANFPEKTPDALLKLSEYKNCGDIMVNSFYDPEKNQIAALEDLLGAHGGTGGYQTRPFILYPSNWSEKAPELYGADQIHKFLAEHLN